MERDSMGIMSFAGKYNAGEKSKFRGALFSGVFGGYL
jgi:hypothetical protein